MVNADKRHYMEHLVELTEKLENELQEIGQRDVGILERAHLSVLLCRDLLQTFKKDIGETDFTSRAEEIDFFKRIKQVPLQQLIYHSEIHSFEIQFPKGSRKEQQKYIRRKIKRINRFYRHHREFVNYVEAGHSHFDTLYYTRNAMDQYHVASCEFYFQDPDFFTPRDMLLAKVKGYAQLLGYLEQRLVTLSAPNQSINGTKKNDKIPWPFGDTDFGELVYALHAAGIKDHGVSIITLSRKLQQVFDVRPKNLYKIRRDIGNRKKTSAVFLERCTLALIQLLEQEDE